MIVEAFYSAVKRMNKPGVLKFFETRPLYYVNKTRVPLDDTNKTQILSYYEN